VPVSVNRGQKSGGWRGYHGTDKAGPERMNRGNAKRHGFWKWRSRISEIGEVTNTGRGAGIGRLYWAVEVASVEESPLLD
jgi:hypothetical protein